MQWGYNHTEGKISLSVSRSSYFFVFQFHTINESVSAKRNKATRTGNLCWPTHAPLPNEIKHFQHLEARQLDRALT